MKPSSIGSLVACALLAFPLTATVAPIATHVMPPDSYPRGLSYADWSAGWWQWFMQHPLDCHPAIDDPQCDVTAGQSGKVRYLSTVLDFDPSDGVTPCTRTIEVTPGTSLFIGLLNAEMSSQEGVPDEETQRWLANFQADAITELSFSVDGQAVENIFDYRFESNQFTFTAPDPWIFGPAGAGEFGTAVADGYYVFLAPMSAGQHVLRTTGKIYFEPGVFGPDPVELNADTTYIVNVQ